MPLRLPIQPGRCNGYQVVANYVKRIAQAEAFGDKGLAIRLEDILAEETDHAEELERLGR